MINKESKDKDSKDKDTNKPDEKARIDVSAHIVIKDVTTGQVLVDKRG